MIKGLILLALLTLNISQITIAKKDNYLLFGSDSDSGEESLGDSIPERTTFNTIPNSSYFSNLLSNFGNNQTNSTCGYVALAMLLSYYDNVLNDNIVADDYEVDGINGESNGTLFEPDANMPTNPDNVPGYYNVLRNHVEDSLHAYLILKDKNAIDVNPPNNYIASTYKAEFGTNEYDLSALALSYLSEMNINQYCNIVSNVSYGTSYSVDDIVDEIIAELSAGRPVLCGFSGHARIVYGYSSTMTTHFLCHDGYVNLSARDLLAPYDGGFDLYGNPYEIGYVSLHFNFHVHSYTDHYVYYNSQKHKAYCSCGNYVLKTHSYLININNNPCQCGASL